MQIQRLTPDAALAALTSHADGLSAREADRRLREFGLNQIERLQTASSVRRLLREITHLFALVLWVAAGLALLAELVNPGQGMGTLALASLLAEGGQLEDPAGFVKRLNQLMLSLGGK